MGDEERVMRLWSRLNKSGMNYGLWARFRFPSGIGNGLLKVRFEKCLE